MIYNSKLNIISQLINHAEYNNNEHKLAATLIIGNKMVIKPCLNISKSKIYGSNICTLHAEANAIKSYYGLSFYYNKNKNIVHIPDDKKHKKLDLIVIRINKNGDLCNSRPCYNCLDMMKIVGIRKVYYSMINENSLVDIICENVKDMISIQSSSIVKNIDKTFNINNFNNIDEYYINLLKKKIPNKIKFNNLIKFLKYNLYLLSNFTIEISKCKNNYIIIIKNNGSFVLYSNIIK